MGESTHSPRMVRFGVYEVDLRAGELRKSGVKIKLQEQPFQILALLLERPGEVVTREQTLRVSQTIAEAVTVPVNGDGERGYGHAHEVGETVRGYIVAGCAGMNIEDSGPHLPGEPTMLVPVAEHLEKLEAIMATKRELGSEFFVNARVDSFMAFRDNPDAALEEGISRG
ncbi:MAG: isocitrate lyase/phosphoenolpyruvate mutase family protein, partial [Acidobacteria bacterium]|nr:isocitrate lyase/phosphoenolpyruvate mutase family protein [Acidobacteriota bacterium]